MTTLAAIAFDPAIRGVLVVMVGVGVLIGSVYLLLATNTGKRLGLLLALAGLTGWLFSMGIFSVPKVSTKTESGLATPMA